MGGLSSGSLRRLMDSTTGDGVSGPRFSVIIPTYNRPNLLRKAVQSVLEQTVEDFEVIVVNDNGSEPESLPDDPRLKVISRVVNGGHSAARNTGLRVATGRYVTFLDDDDLYLPNRLALGLRGLSRTPITICMLSAFTDDPAQAGPPRGRWLEGDVHDIIFDGPAPQAGVVTVDRELSPLFNESYLACEDVEWWFRLSSRGRVSTVDEVGVLQRDRGGPRDKKAAQSRLDHHIRLLEDHTDYFATHRRARSYRHQRIGIRALAQGDKQLARRSLAKSFIQRPTIKSAWHLFRSLVR